MPFQRFARITLALLLALSSVLAGCSRQDPATLAGAWPVADSERTVPKPAGLERWPLSGMPAEGADTSIRPVSIKIENSPAARPQSALQLADVVYESLTEGSITRFNAIFHSNSPQVVGPVRSARQSDVYIVPQYHALFAHVGGNSQVIANVRAAPIDDLDQFYNPGPYWRSSDRPRPHNMYTSVPKLRELGSQKGYDETVDLRGFLYELAPTDSEPQITEITIPFAPGNVARWVYDPEAGVYKRFHASTPHSDAVTGEQITARNVVVLWAKHSTMSYRDVTGSPTLDIMLNGTGRCSVFRDGQRFDGVWRTDGDAPPTFTTEDGEPIRLAPGNTWIQVVKTSVSISMQ
ncbi:MAG: DUF3048 domain-containing protein [Coriobacteriia bacterium]